MPMLKVGTLNRPALSSRSLRLLLPEVVAIIAMTMTMNKNEWSEAIRSACARAGLFLTKHKHSGIHPITQQDADNQKSMSVSFLCQVHWCLCCTPFRRLDLLMWTTSHLLHWMRCRCTSASMPAHPATCTLPSTHVCQPMTIRKIVFPIARSGSISSFTPNRSPSSWRTQSFSTSLPLFQFRSESVPSSCGSMSSGEAEPKKKSFKTQTEEVRHLRLLIKHFGQLINDMEEKVKKDRIQHRKRVGGRAKSEPRNLRDNFDTSSNSRWMKQGSARRSSENSCNGYERKYTIKLSHSKLSSTLHKLN